MLRAIVTGMGRLLATFYDIIPNYGVAIILLTVLVRTAMIPLAIKQAHMMIAQREKFAKVKALQPEIKKIKEKYRDDRARAYEEQKKLMDHHGVNTASMLGGCLPTLLQIPIFMAMYQVLSGCPKLLFSRKCIPTTWIPKTAALHAAVGGGGATFLTMKLTGRPSAVLRAGGVGQAWPYYLFCLFMGATMYYQTKLMSKGQTGADPQMIQTQKIMQRFFPAMVTFASINFPVGLTVYWSATNLWTIGQQSVLLKRFGPQAQLPEPAKPQKGKKQDSGDTSGKGSPPVKPAANGPRPDAVSSKGANGQRQVAPGAKPKGSGARKGKSKKKRKSGR
ncbi:MAG: YidC/Oxa1 family membrane protein insertase [Actinomycetota bacterium]